MSAQLTSVQQESIYNLFSAKDSFFVIPDYQRPYAWEDNECSTLWDDICSFALPDGDFHSNDDEYFLGPIVVFSNDDKKLEIIDGQQRLISILLLLRAFYEDMKDFTESWSVFDVRKNIGRCIWKTDEQGNPDFSVPKIDSQVATDDDRDELMAILQSGIVEKNCKSRYANNYRLFQRKIQEFSDSKDF